MQIVLSFPREASMLPSGLKLTKSSELGDFPAPIVRTAWDVASSHSVMSGLFEVTDASDLPSGLKQTRTTGRCSPVGTSPRRNFCGLPLRASQRQIVLSRVAEAIVLLSG